MNISNSTPAKLATDLFRLQITWSLWYLAVITLAHLISYFIPNISFGQPNPETFVLLPSKGYMALIAIIACLGYLPYCVKNGITRRDYFTASSIAAVGVAIFISVFYLMTSIAFTHFSAYSTELPNAQIANTNSVLLATLSLCLILTAHYVGGWIGAIGFYRYQLPGKIGFIAMAFVFLALVSALWEREFKLPFTSNSLQIPDMPIELSIGLTLILIGLGLVLIRLTSKRVSIKVS